MSTLARTTDAYDIDRGYTVRLCAGEPFRFAERNHAPFRDLVIVGDRHYSILTRDLVVGGAG